MLDGGNIRGLQTDDSDDIKGVVDPEDIKIKTSHGSSFDNENDEIADALQKPIQEAVAKAINSKLERDNAIKKAAAIATSIAQQTVQQEQEQTDDQPETEPSEDNALIGTKPRTPSAQEMAQAQGAEAAAIDSPTQQAIQTESPVPETINQPAETPEQLETPEQEQHVARELNQNTNTQETSTEQSQNTESTESVSGTPTIEGGEPGERAAQMALQAAQNGGEQKEADVQESENEPEEINEEDEEEIASALKDKIPDIEKMVKDKISSSIKAQMGEGATADLTSKVVEKGIKEKKGFNLKDFKQYSEEYAVMEAKSLAKKTIDPLIKEVTEALLADPIVLLIILGVLVAFAIYVPFLGITVGTYCMISPRKVGRKIVGLIIWILDFSGKLDKYIKEFKEMEKMKDVKDIDMKTKALKKGLKSLVSIINGLSDSLVPLIFIFGVCIFIMNLIITMIFFFWTASISAAVGLVFKLFLSGISPENLY